MKSTFIISIIAIILIVILAIQNSAVVSLQLFFWNVDMSLSLMLLIIFLLGAISGYVFHFSLGMKRRRAIRNL